MTNLRLCFPQWSPSERKTKAREVFGYFMQSWLDRLWLWHSPQTILNKRLRLISLAGQSIQGLEGSIIFAPHFVGLDAGWTALNRLTEGAYATIYAAQNNAAIDAWVKTGRSQSSSGHVPPLLIDHHAGVRPIVQAVRRGASLYLLPDMNYEPLDSVFVPFFGIPAATLPILPRYAKLGKTKVVPVVTRMTKRGYDVEIHPAWTHYPSGDTAADLATDTLRMNQELERFVLAMPAQYYWVHRRFKDQPDGQSSPYAKDAADTKD